MRDGAYTADRAAALSGVPLRTVHHWAREGVLVPSVSSERIKLWSYSDLLGLRTIYWLRHTKRAPDTSQEVPATPMGSVRRALSALRELDVALFEGDRPAIAVTRSGEVLIRPVGRPVQWADGQLVLIDALDLIAPFHSLEGGRGPDLVAPRPLVRILPRKMAGAPHVLDTRVETEALYALGRRGFGLEQIQALYPEISHGAISDALDIEAQLAKNLARAA